jgi:large conductance mechanosensitive channel
VVADLFMPVVGRIFGGLDFSNYSALAGSPTACRWPRRRRRRRVRLRQLHHRRVNFVILAFIIFLMVKQINRLQAREPPPPAARRKRCSCCAKSAIR